MTQLVSIHAPRVGCDRWHGRSTARRSVSIHAPRVGCDKGGSYMMSFEGSFNSRTPCGVRPITDTCLRAAQQFQFTHPVWGATGTVLALRDDDHVSIHAPRVGCDSLGSACRGSPAGFNSRTPCGVRRIARSVYQLQGVRFNSRTPCGVRPLRALLRATQ